MLNFSLSTLVKHFKVNISKEYPLKQLVKNIFAAALLSSALLSSVVMAEQKVGVVNVEGIFQQMPQAIATQQTLAIEFKDEQASIEGLRQVIAADIEKLRKDAPTMSESQIKEGEAKINQARVEFEAKVKPFQEKVQARSKAENDRLLQMLNQAIQAVATEEKLDLIMDRKSVVFVSPTYDISEKVLKKVSQLK